MPLLKGKKNIGHNVKVEEEHGKPKDQAVAIALHTAGVPKKGKAHKHVPNKKGYCKHCGKDMHR
jgi:hypothetical protein